MTIAKLYSGKMTPHSKTMWFWGFKTPSGKLMQLGSASRTRGTANKKRLIIMKKYQL